MKMDNLTFCGFIICSVLLNSWSGVIHAFPHTSNLSMMEEASGSTEKHDLTYNRSIILSSQDPMVATTIYIDGQGTMIEHNLFRDILSFMQENLFLILVITGLIIIIFLIICSSLVLSRRRKVSSYYPCAFPSKMYVNESDKTGGARIFCEVPEKPPSSLVEEPTNRAKKLQEDILLATRNLRTPTKSPWKEDKTKLSRSESAEEPDWEKDGNSTMADEKNPEQSVSKKDEEDISSETSQDMAPVGHVEKSDPSKAEEALENDCQPGSNEETLEVKDKQDVAAPGLSFISEEKTAF